MLRPAKLPWVLLLLFPLVEVGAHALTRARVAPRSDFRAAAAHVRQQWRDKDAVVAAPAWADPRLREVLGERIDWAMAGRSDLAAYERLWVLSIRGALPSDAPARAADYTRDFGRVRVSRWDLGESPDVFDLTSHVRDAAVYLDGRPCPFRAGARPRGGGLGKGVLAPRERFVCDPRRPWLWVADVVMEDLELRPRHCVYQHPEGEKPLRVSFPRVPLGDRFVFYGGLYYEHERMRKGGRVVARVLIDGEERGRMTHRDGDGWARLSLPTAHQGASAEVTIEVRAERAHRRSFCWAASTRRGSQPRGR